MTTDFVPFLNNFPASTPLLWVLDIESGEVLDASPATARLMASLDYTRITRTTSPEENAALNATVVATGEERTMSEWVKYDSQWRKLTRSKNPLGGNLILEVTHEITHLDPRAEWLSRINLANQRLELKNGESISFNEFVVLHLLLKGFKHDRIADTLNVSRKTVEYRISRIKNALEVESTEQMMMEVSSSGMIYLATVPIDPGNPAKTELELYKRVPD